MVSAPKTQRTPKVTQSGGTDDEMWVEIGTKVPVLRADPENESNFPKSVSLCVRSLTINRVNLLHYTV